MFEKIVEVLVMLIVILTFFAGIYIFVDSRVHQIEKKNYFDNISRLLLTKLVKLEPLNIFWDSKAKSYS